MRSPYYFLIALMFFSCKKSNEVTIAPQPYHEKYRPQFHFSPPKGWMNDPNGMVFIDGEYHLFYQHYPDTAVWGPMHWGHAVSKDLVHWQNEAIALYPDSLGYIFSGSAVYDKENTSGLGSIEQPPVVAIFTQHRMEGEKSGRNDFQTQGIAFSLDKGRTWKMYDQNPVIRNTGKRDFRDPKVSWHEPSKQWVMILAVQDHVEFYGSKNLREWSFLSEFGKDTGSHGGVWECPDLFTLKDNNGVERWVMLLSINPGGPQGGSATQYFIGNFDGKTFSAQDSLTRWVDYGADNYAGVTWSGVPTTDGRRIFLGWMSNWQYAQIVPTTVWRSAMTIPRTLFLITINDQTMLASNPATEMLTIRGDEINIALTVDKHQPESIPVEIPSTPSLMSLDIERPMKGVFSIKLANEKGEEVRIGIDTLNRLYIDRTKSGITNFSKDFPAIHYGQRLSSENNVNLKLWIDTSSIEMFADSGTLVMTDLVFPTTPLTKLTLQGTDKVNASIKAYSLQAIWD